MVRLLITVFSAQGKTISLSQETKKQFELPTILEGQNLFPLSKTWQEEIDLELDDKHQLSLEITPQAPIDWDNTKIENRRKFRAGFLS